MPTAAFCSPFLHFCSFASFSSCFRRKEGKRVSALFQHRPYWRKMRLPAIKCVAVRLYSLNSDFEHCFYLGGPKLLTSIHLNPSNGRRKAPHKCRFRVPSTQKSALDAALPPPLPPIHFLLSGCTPSTRVSSTRPPRRLITREISATF